MNTDVLIFSKNDDGLVKFCKEYKLKRKSLGIQHKQRLQKF